ncbi:MAG: TlpA family protein disulfide reductase [Chitinophagaceae bacterium]
MKFSSKWLLVALLVSCFNYGNEIVAQSTSGKATLFGKLVGFGESAELEEFSELQHLLPKSASPVFQIGKDSSFSVNVSVSTPRYYRLGRNKLYLSPGDRMEVFIDKGNPEIAIIKGKGSEANIYLRSTPFPKGGSYLDAGRQIKNLPAETLDYILQAGRQREKELLSAKSLTPSFIRLEKARIRADLYKSIKAVDSYSRNKFRKESEAFIKLYNEEFQWISKKIKDSLLRGFVNPEYLQIEVYRDIIGDLDLKGARPDWVRIIMDWKKSNDLAFSKIKPLTDKSRIPGFQPVVDSIQTKKYRDVLNALLKDKMKFGNGDPVIDIVCRSLKGENVSLSSLKGKVIYIDLWATWCGPCMAEMPHFEELKKHYVNNPEIAIVSLSIDDNDPVWIRNVQERKAEGIQWRIDRPKLVDYGVESVPRYILIGKDFKVAELNAPRAADPALRSMIDKLLSS